MRFVGAIAEEADTQKARADVLEQEKDPNVNRHLIKALNILLRGWPGKVVGADTVEEQKTLTARGGHNDSMTSSQTNFYSEDEMTSLRKAVKITQGRSANI